MIFFIFFLALLNTLGHSTAFFIPSLTNVRDDHAQDNKPALSATNVCAPREFGHRRPLVVTCNHAISGLSTSRDVGIFHQGGLDDEFRLPVTREVGARGLAGSCLVQIELKQGAVADQSTWETISSAAMQLSLRCQSPVPGVFVSNLVYTGGVASIGAADNILIYIVSL